MDKKQCKTRVIAVLRSGVAMTVDFYTPNDRIALIQFGAEYAEELEADPVVMVSSIELGREGWTEEEDTKLSETYLGDMLAEIDAAR